MTTEEITIVAGDVTLSGTCTTPDGPGPYPAGLILAGSGPLDRDGNAKRLPLNLSRDLARTLAEHGWASVRYDKRGVGSSTGDYLATGFCDELADAEAALGWLAGRPDVSMIVPVGHSAGASMAAELAVRHDTVDRVVLLAVTAQTGENTLIWQAAQIAPTLPAFARGVLRLMRTDVLRQQRKALDRIMATEGDVARVQGAKVNARWMREFIAYDPVPTLGRIEVPVLAMTGSKDVQVNPDDVGAIATLLPSAQTHVVADVDHILRYEPRPRSDVRRYKKQVTQPIDPRVETLLLDWLAEPSQGSSRVSGAPRTFRS
ncbi:MAG: alpha/beta fold hydrolase [Jiangellales bacterium]